jgi:hypothetical protein
MLSRHDLLHAQLHRRGAQNLLIKDYSEPEMAEKGLRTVGSHGGWGEEERDNLKRGILTNERCTYLGKRESVVRFKGARTQHRVCDRPSSARREEGATVF